jgi:uncharacterized protein YjbI with pentapeptide repeats
MPARPLDLKNAKLDGKVFTSDELIGADFTNAAIDNCTFSECDLSGLNFTGARFESCKFESSYGIGVQCRGAQFEDCNFSKSSFRASTFAGVSIKYSNLSESSFDACDFSNSSLWYNQLSRTSIVRSNLEFSQIQGDNENAADVCTLNLEGSTLWQFQARAIEYLQFFGLPNGWIHRGGHLIGPGAVFDGEDLHHINNAIDLEHVTVTGVEFRNFNFRYSTLENVQFVDCIFIDCTFGGNFEGSDFTASRFESTFSSAVCDFSGSHLELTKFPEVLRGFTGSGTTGRPRSLPGGFRLVSGSIEPIIVKP